MLRPLSVDRPWSIRGHFLLFGVILALPLATLASALIVQIGQTVRHDTEERMRQVAAAIAADLDRDLQRHITILQTLATSATLAQRNFRAFHARAQVAAKSAKVGIFLVDPSLRQLLNTNVPFGSVLPDYGAPDTARRTYQTKVPQISDFFIGRVIKRPVFDIAIPIMWKDEVAFVLAMGLEPPLLDEILRAHKLPPDWIVNVADAKGVIIARSTPSKQVIGSTIAPHLLAQPHDTVRQAVNVDGLGVLRAVARSRTANWQIAVNVPLALADAPIRKSYLLLGLWAAAAILLTALLAGWFARRMAHPIGAAANAAAGLIHRKPIAAFRSSVIEANELMGALRHAAGELSEAEKQRDLAEEQQRLANRGLAQSVARQAALYRFADRLHRANGLDEVYDAALDTILHALKCERASILLRDHTGVMRFVRWRGLSDAYRQAVDGHSPWAPGQNQIEPVIVPDVAAADMDDLLRTVVLREGIAALAFIPLMANGGLIGKFMTYYDTPHVFSEDELDLSVIIARHLALSIDRNRADETEKLLVSELQHRTKNFVAVVHAIASRSLRGTAVLENARDDFMRRLGVMARAYDQMTSAPLKGTRLTDLVQSELEPYSGRTKIQGIDVVLTPQVAQNFALALHELATNAAKYGALSKPEGEVAICWTLVHRGDRNVLAFRWQEMGGPPVVEPKHVGFGSALLKQTLGEARITYPREGLIYEVDLVIDQVGRAA